MIALGLLLLAVVASDHVSSFLIAILGVILFCVLAAGVAQLLRTAREARRLRIFTAYRTTPSRVIVFAAGSLLLSLVPGAILFLTWESFWLATHGGGTAIALTGSLVLVAALLVSALARLLVSGALAVLGLFRWRAHKIAVGSSFVSLWDSGEAIAVVAATVLSISAIGLGVWSQQSGDNFVRAVSPREPVRSLATATPRQLLTGLAPVLAFTGNDSWPPQRVDPFLSESTVLDLRGGAEMLSPSVDDLTNGCPRAAKPCLLVEPGCAGRPCATGATDSPHPVAYGRVILKEEDSRVSWAISPFRNELTGLAQWWIFAPYDRWSAPLFLGLGTAIQEHAADWEAVTIGFSRKRPSSSP